MQKFKAQILTIFLRTDDIVRRSISLTVRNNAEQQVPNLSPYDVNLMLRENEFSHTFVDGHTVHSFESNQLGSNKPCEDARTEGSFLHKNGFICGIFDGHAGPSCAQVISKRLLRYIAASTISLDILRKEIAQGCTSQSFLRCYNDKVDFVKEIKTLYEENFNKYIQEIASQQQESNRIEAIQNAFIHLDNDLSTEALNNTNSRTMSVAMSGSVVCVALIENRDLHIASTGDCSAVLGIQCAETGRWKTKKLNQEHTTDNLKEVNRIISEHPKKESDSILRNERLLGQLAPLRAFGDFRYKWSNEILYKYVVPTFGENSVPPNYHTPPYLTAQPDIEHHLLTPNDKFLVIASDGLFDFLSHSQVVDLVGEHMLSKKILEPLKISQKNNTSLGEISDTLVKRKAGRKRKPLDQNSATHLIRNALGGTEYGIEHSKISYLLTLPQDVVRLYRDDITITVIYFNSDSIEKSL